MLYRRLSHCKGLQTPLHRPQPVIRILLLVVIDRLTPLIVVVVGILPMTNLYDRRHRHITVVILPNHTPLVVNLLGTPLRRHHHVVHVILPWTCQVVHDLRHRFRVVLEGGCPTPHLRLHPRIVIIPTTHPLIITTTTNNNTLVIVIKALH